MTVSPEQLHAQLDARWSELLGELLEVALFATGADLVRSPGVGPRTVASVEAIEVATEPVTLLRPNAQRKGAMVYNDSPSPLVLYIKFGPGADADDFTVKLAQDDYYELPVNYRGEITGVWSAAGTGAARVTEFSW